MLDSPDKTALYEKSRICVNNIAHLIANAKVAAEYSEDDVSLLDGARKLAECVARLLMTQKLHGSDDARTKEASKQFAATQRYLALAIEGKGVSDAATVEMIAAYREAAEDAVAAVRKLADEVALSTPDQKKPPFVAATKQATQQADNALKLTSILEGCTASDDCRNAVLDAVQVARTFTSALNKSVNEAQPKDLAKKQQFVGVSTHLDETLKALADVVACSQSSSADDYGKLKRKIENGVATLHNSHENKDMTAKGTRQVMMNGEKLINALMRNEGKTGDDLTKAQVSKGLLICYFVNVLRSDTCFSVRRACSGAHCARPGHQGVVQRYRQPEAPPGPHCRR
jgi:hypothetical protein